MKFTGLILICATSCLALILPAIGVVQFPKVKTQNNSPLEQMQQATPLWNGQAWNQPNTPGSAGVMPSGSIPISTNTSQNFNPLAPHEPQSVNPENAVPSSKFGLGIWLMLAPVCLLGLAMWTFGSNPSGSKPRFGKS